MKKNIFIIFIFSFCAFYWFATYTINLQSSLADKVIRLHILANSNSSIDQAIKLKVRDNVIKEISPLLEKSKSISESREIINNNINFIETVANNTLSQFSNDKAVATLAKSNFPVKTYSNISFPAGEYEALKITIGEGRGENWWCVMFPPLCFTNSAVKFDEDSVATLQENLSAEEYKLISEPHKSDVKIKFKLLELFN